MIAVLDSSVAVKWYAAEEGSEQAAALIGSPLAAPDLIRLEVGHALWRKVRRGEMRREQADAALPHLTAALALLPADPLTEQALEMAFEAGHPVYDCVFLAAARLLGVPLLTADRELASRIGGTDAEPGVVLLEEWEGSDV